MKTKMYAIAIIRVLLSLLGYIPRVVAFLFFALGYAAEGYLSSHSAFVTSTKQLLQAFDKQLNKAE